MKILLKDLEIFYTCSKYKKQLLLPGNVDYDFILF